MLQREDYYYSDPSPSRESSSPCRFPCSLLALLPCSTPVPIAVFLLLLNFSYWYYRCRLGTLTEFLKKDDTAIRQGILLSHRHNPSWLFLDSDWQFVGAASPVPPSSPPLFPSSSSAVSEISSSSWVVMKRIARRLTFFHDCSCSYLYLPVSSDMAFCVSLIKPCWMQGKDFQRKQEFGKGLTTYIWILDIGEGGRVWGVVRGTSKWWLTSEKEIGVRERHITDTDQTLFTLFLRVWLSIDFVWWLLLYWSLLALSLMLSLSLFLMAIKDRQTEHPLYVSQTTTLRRTPLDTETHIFIRRVTMTETTLEWERNLDTLMVWWPLTPTHQLSMVSPTL